MATPMFTQYLDLKRQYADCILLFRLGDFYEGFAEDARTLSKVLGLTLTGRGEGENRQPMAGIPYHALKTYLPKLIKAGYKVAIADQLEEPKPGQIVKRDVTKVITAGTIIDENVLDVTANNFLASIYLTVKKGVHFWGLSFADISTGEFKVTEFVEKGEQIPRPLLIELFRIRVAELILPASLGRQFSELLPGITIHTEDDSSYFEKELQQKILDHYGAASFKSFGLEQINVGLTAAGKLFTYLMFNRKSALPHLQVPTLLANENYMLLDEATIRNLELVQPLKEGNEDKTLFAILNRCQTPMGQRRLRQWLIRPLVKVPEINQRNSSVNDLFQNFSFCESVISSLNEISDLERILSKIGGKSANARDLLFLKTGLQNSLSVLKSVQSEKSAKSLHTYINENIDATLIYNVVDLIARSIKSDPAVTISEGDIIASGFDQELDELKAQSGTGKEYIKNLETREIEKTGINSLKVKFNRVFGYFIEVSKSNVPKVPQHYIRKQTTVNGERYITEELKQWEDKVLNASEKINLLEFQIFEKVRAQILKEIGQMQILFEFIANIDVLVNFARIAKLNNYTKPEISDDPDAETIIIAGRHPVVESFLPGTFVPNDIKFAQEDQQLIILTGPNMSGKSTFIRQTALLFLMAQCGSFIPAQKAKIVIADRIFTRVGASDNLAGGESTFMVEMSETANILHNATSRSLIILDEVGRGTSTFDGVAIAWAIVEHLSKNIGARTLFATHYHELVLLEELFTNIKNYQVQVIEAQGEVSFLHKIIKGGIDKSYGIHVAGLAGVPKTIVSRAVKILDQLQKRSVNNIVNQHIQHQHEQMGMSLTPESNIALPELTKLQQELLAIDLDSLTPLAALQKLKNLQDTAHGIK